MKLCENIYIYYLLFLYIYLHFFHFKNLIIKFSFLNLIKFSKKFKSIYIYEYYLAIKLGYLFKKSKQNFQKMIDNLPLEVDLYRKSLVTTLN